MNPFVFIVGCPRSGTTLLGRIADAHPELAVIHESRWIARTWQRRKGLTPDGRVTSRLSERLTDPRVLKAFELGASEIEALVDAHAGSSLPTFVTILFDGYGERRGKRLVGDKSPGYVRYLPLLHELWPTARFVHIIRDPRDVYLSVLDWGKGATRFATFQRDPATTAAVWWRWYVELGREAAADLGPRHYHELRYESLVDDPERECRRLCDFLGLRYSPEMLRFHEGRTRGDPRLDAKKAWRPITGGLRDWRTQLGPDDARRLTAAAGDVMQHLDYEHGAAEPDSAEAQHADRIRAAFAREAVARLRPIPRSWRDVADDGDGNDLEARADTPAAVA